MLSLILFISVPLNCNYLSSPPFCILVGELHGAGGLAIVSVPQHRYDIIVALSKSEGQMKG